MYKLKVDKPILDIAGNIIPTSETDQKPFAVGKAMAQYLQYYRGQKIDAIKAKSLAIRFYKDAEVDIDKADLLALREVFKEDTQMSVLVKADILELLQDVEETKE